MSEINLEHFKRAAIEVGENGDNDTLPFDTDNTFVQNCIDDLAALAFSFFQSLEGMGKNEARKKLNSLQVFSERLLAPTGSSGFRITTKVHPFWTVYFNGLGIALAEKLEPNRSETAHSYRFLSEGKNLFDRARSWRAFLQATTHDSAINLEGAVVVRTDISSFYEHIYHHRLENCVGDFFIESSTIATQVDKLLNKFSAGRSFGLPVGGQCSRILAETLMSSIDRSLTEKGIVWHRYVDDFVLIAASKQDAYTSLSVLSNELADYGLSLNRSKTIMLSARHYKEYVDAQLFSAEDESKDLREIDLHFDPYSDNPIGDYTQLKETVSSLNVPMLLNLELQKAQPEPFLVTQISRTLKFHEPQTAIQLCETLLDPSNLHSFRASWSTIMRGVTSIRLNEANSVIFEELDKLIDQIPSHSSHLLSAESNLLFYLKLIKSKKTEQRASFAYESYQASQSLTVKVACIECWRAWGDRSRFLNLRNRWQTLGEQEQRIVWLAFGHLGDEGRHSKQQVKLSIPNVWSLGIEAEREIEFYAIYKQWASNACR